MICVLVAYAFKVDYWIKEQHDWNVILLGETKWFDEVKFNNPMQIEDIELNAKEVYWTDVDYEAYVGIGLYKISPKHCLFFQPCFTGVPTSNASNFKCAVFIIFVFGMN